MWSNPVTPGMSYSTRRLFLDAKSGMGNDLASGPCSSDEASAEALTALLSRAAARSGTSTCEPFTAEEAPLRIWRAPISDFSCVSVGPIASHSAAMHSFLSLSPVGKAGGNTMLPAFANCLFSTISRALIMSSSLSLSDQQLFCAVPDATPVLTSFPEDDAADMGPFWIRKKRAYETAMLFSQQVRISMRFIRVHNKQSNHRAQACVWLWHASNRTALPTNSKRKSTTRLVVATRTSSKTQPRMWRKDIRSASYYKPEPWVHIQLQCERVSKWKQYNKKLAVHWNVGNRALVSPAAALCNSPRALLLICVHPSWPLGSHHKAMTNLKRSQRLPKVEWTASNSAKQK